MVASNHLLTTIPTLGRHEILKRDRQVYIPPLPAPTGMFVFHFDMISLLISNATPHSGFPLRFPCRGCTFFLYSVIQTCHVQLGVSDILSCSAQYLTSASENKTFSAMVLVCETLAVLRCVQMSLFTSGQGKIFRDLWVTWRCSILHFSFENVTNKQKSESMLNFPSSEHL